MLKVFTDGSAIINKKNSDSGYAYFIPELKILDGGFIIGTNNIAELLAIQRSLTLIYQLRNFITKRQIEIITDSEYSILVLTKDAKLKANVELIRATRKLIKLMEDNGFDINFRHVGSHGKIEEGQSASDTDGNRIVDQVANRMARGKGAYILHIDDKNNIGYNFNISWN